jgi:hypothetical protein
MIVAGAVLLTAVLTLPWICFSADVGDALTRFSVRLALVYYAAALTLMLLLQRAEWSAARGRGRLARWCWTWSCLTYAVHVTLAFHFYHHWSHADAVRHTFEVSGFGPGIYVSHLFTALWSSDVAAWWLAPAWYARRSVWIDRGLHAFMVFVVFNATIVYESGPIRWAGVALFGELALVWWYRQRQVPDQDYSCPGQGIV